MAAYLFILCVENNSLPVDGNILFVMFGFMIL